jgi:hypothetical protein
MRKPGFALRAGVTLAASALAVLAAASCDDPNRQDRGYDCAGYGGGRCRTVCDYWCDDWGCYPSCWDQCFGSCAGPGMSSPPSATGTGATDASTRPVTDAGLAGDGGGVLCSACVANDDCESGALCVLRGGSPSSDAAATDASAPAPTATGFCSHACGGVGDCPQGFTCTQLGSSKQCLPNAGACP